MATDTFLKQLKNQVTTNAFQTTSTNPPTYSIIQHSGGAVATDGTRDISLGTSSNIFTFNTTTASTIRNSTSFTFTGTSVVQVKESEEIENLQNAYDQLQDEHEELLYMLQKVMRHHHKPSRFKSLLKRFGPRLEQLKESFGKIKEADV